MIPQLGPNPIQGGTKIFSLCRGDFHLTAWEVELNLDNFVPMVGIEYDFGPLGPVCRLGELFDHRLGSLSQLVGNLTVTCGHDDSHGSLTPSPSGGRCELFR
ncbi:MAG: hypothetical protein OER89_15715, partial [Gemmatimonadota bacterium]|nr:hypothetical protein [Gemmatimonadota bacterium]